MPEEEYLALSGLQHFAFCRRQWAMIHIEQQWAENLRTVEGGLLHDRAHFAYTLLANYCAGALESMDLDAYVGFLFYQPEISCFWQVIQYPSGIFVWFCGRTPRWVRGLKFACDLGANDRATVAPVRGARVELIEDCAQSAAVLRELCLLRVPVLVFNQLWRKMPFFVEFFYRGSASKRL